MDSRPFVLFGTSHIVTLVGFTIIVVVCLHFLATLSGRNQRRARSFILWMVVVDLLVWRALPVIDDQFAIGLDLPVAVCSVSQIMLAVYLCRPKQWLFDILFYWVLIGSSLAMLVPDLQQAFPSWRFFGMFVSHGVNIFTMLYLIVVRRDAPSEGSYHVAFVALATYAICFALPVDVLAHTNYLFLLSPPDMDLSVLHVLPAWPWYWIVLLGFFYGAFRLAHATYFHFMGSPAKSHERYAH